MKSYLHFSNSIKNERPFKTSINGPNYRCISMEENNEEITLIKVLLYALLLEWLSFDLVNEKKEITW